jgi:trans-aconitate 2-methyltransferase
MSTSGSESGRDHTNDDWDAQTYHRVSTPQFTWGEAVLERLSLEGDETVMDAGAGTGRLTERLLERLPRGRVVLVDQSASMLERARTFLEPRFGARVRLVQADLADLQMDQAVDVIFSTATFHWVTDHPKLFRSLHAALKPGGLLLAQCGGGPNLAHARKRAHALMQEPQFAPHFALWENPWEYADAETTAQRLGDAGFVEVETSLEPAPTSFGGAEEFREFLRAVIFRVHLSYLPDTDLQARFLDEIIKEASRDTPPFTLDYWRLNLRARKPASTV